MSISKCNSELGATVLSESTTPGVCGSENRVGLGYSKLNAVKRKSGFPVQSHTWKSIFKIIKVEIVILINKTMNNLFYNVVFVTKYFHLCSEWYDFNFLLKKPDFRGSHSSQIDRGDI